MREKEVYYRKLFIPNIQIFQILSKKYAKHERNRKLDYSVYHSD